MTNPSASKHLTRFALALLCVLAQIPALLRSSAQEALFPSSGLYTFDFESDPTAAGWSFEKWSWEAFPDSGVPAILATGTSRDGNVRPSSSGLDDTIFGGAEYPLEPIVPATGHGALGFGQRWLVNSGAGNAVDPGSGIFEQTNSGKATLHLTGLPPHSSVDLGFLLAMGDSLDSGNSRNLDGEFDVLIDGLVQFSFTPDSGGDGFAGTPGTRTLATKANLAYAYIEQWEDNSGNGPLDENNRTPRSWTLDSAYDVAAVPDLIGIPHTSDSLTVEFIHRISSDPEDEHLAIDNVRIELSSDSDGMPATWETTHGLDPLSDDSERDPDLDGRSNLEEFQLGSNPRTSDSPFLQCGRWKVRQLRGVDEVRTLTTQDDDTGALDLLEFGIRTTGEKSTTQHRFVNFKEQEFQGWIFPETEEPFPLLGEYRDGEDDHVLEATGNIFVRETGDVTLGFNSNDGGILFIDGEPVVIYNQTRSRGSSLATVTLSEGLHQVRFVTWDRNGSAGATLFYAASAVTPEEISAENIALLQPFDPFSSNTEDTDGDGMDDFAERYFFGDLAQLPSGDFDNDGTSNGAELGQHTAPNEQDSDGDGLTDTAETGTHGTDPSDTDTDDDGASDFLEVATLGSNPLMLDTDSDNFDDHTEARAGTSPTDATSFPGSYGGPVVRHSIWEENFDNYPNGTVPLCWSKDC